MNFIFYKTLVEYSYLILPWFLVGIALAFLIEKFIHPTILKKISGKFNFFEIVLLVISGMISPLSIMSFLPLAKELTEWGIPSAILFSFFIAERAYDLQSFFIISGLFGIRFAVVTAIVILLSLIATTYSLKEESVEFKSKGKRGKESFWIRQTKTLTIVVLGIVLGAALKTYIPQKYFSEIAGGTIGGVVTALVVGFSVYLGPILGNYPVAKAFSDLGMSSAGILTFLTVSPILNFIIIFLFSSSVGFKKTVKAAFVYSITGLVLVMFASKLL